MSEKTERLIFFIALALVNLVVIWFVLSTMTTLHFWVCGLFLLAAVFEDALVLGWSTRILPNYGPTGELSVSGIWSGGQVLQLIVLTTTVALSSLAIGVIVFVLSILWLKWRVSSMNKVMDLR